VEVQMFLVEQFAFLEFEEIGAIYIMQKAAACTG
jgi:hypothetical protein